MRMLEKVPVDLYDIDGDVHNIIEIVQLFGSEERKLQIRQVTED